MMLVDADLSDSGSSECSTRCFGFAVGWAMQGGD